MCTPTDGCCLAATFGSISCSWYQRDDDVVITFDELVDFEKLDPAPSRRVALTRKTRSFTKSKFEADVTKFKFLAALLRTGTDVESADNYSYSRFHLGRSMRRDVEQKCGRHVMSPCYPITWRCNFSLFKQSISLSAAIWWKKLKFYIKYIKNKDPNFAQYYTNVIIEIWCFESVELYRRKVTKRVEKYLVK